MEFVTAEQLVDPARKAAVAQGEPMEIAGVGWILVGGLNRMDALRVQSTDDIFERDRIMLVGGVITPKITPDNAKTWQRITLAGEIERITRKIYELSGMEDDAQKAAFKSTADES